MEKALMRIFLCVTTFLSCIQSTNGIQRCHVDALNRIPCTNNSLKEHAFTSRNLQDLMAVMPPFVKIKNHLNKSVDVLEIGCGNGRALMEIQATVPTASCKCFNKDGYGHEQAHTNGSELIQAALYYNIDVYCRDSTLDPILPTIILSKMGIQDVPMPFRNESFDIIFSHHALNQDKLHTRDSSHIAPRIARLLKTGGYASMLLLNRETHYVFPYINCTVFSPAKILNLAPSANKTFSIMLYVVRKSVGMMIRRCSVGQTFARDWGCILPPGAATFPFNATKYNLFASAITHHPLPNKTPRDWKNGYYPINYLSFLYQWFRLVEQQPWRLLSE